MRRKIVQLVHFQHPVDSWALYEAILDTENNKIDKITDTPIKNGIFFKYQEAIQEWGKVENKYSGLLDILDEMEYNEILAEEQESELSF